jgi:hypothetical protein
MLLLLAAASAAARYRECTAPGPTFNCTTVEWTDVDSAFIPCSLLPRDFRVCASRGLEKFRAEFPDAPGALSGDGCGGLYDGVNRFGRAVCRPPRGVVCRGAQSWIVDDYRCAADGSVSHLTVFATSLFFGFFGVDRFVLGYALLGTLKLLSLGGVGLWWLCDLTLIAVGALGPHFDARFAQVY